MVFSTYLVIILPFLSSDCKNFSLKSLGVTDAVVLFEVDGELSNHDRVLHVHLHPVQPLDALLAGVPLCTRRKSGLKSLKKIYLVDDGWTPPGHGITDPHRLTDVDCSVHEVVVDDLVLD